MARRKRKNGRKNNDVEFLQQALNSNGQAVQEGPKRKTWSTHDIRTITPLSPAQEETFHSWHNFDHLCLHGSAGTGKAQPLDANILTPDGWTTMKDISVGDMVSTPDGKCAPVIGVFPQGKKDIFKITFHDGATTRCCGDHLWEVWYSDKKGYEETKKIITTFELIDLIDNDIAVSIPVIIPSETPEALVPVPPYLLGILLSDDGIASEVSFNAKDDKTLKLVTKQLESNYNVNINSDSIYKYNSLAEKHNMVVNINDIVDIYKHNLKELGLLGQESQTKFIPKIYVDANTEQRLELIRGLFDSNGIVNKNKNDEREVLYTTTNLLIAQQAQEILWSLGATCSIMSQYICNGNNKEETEEYTLLVSHPTPEKLFNLTRKKELCSDKFNNGKLAIRRRVVSVELTSNEYAQCIMIDHPQHLYITNDYVVTHNTFLACALALPEILNKNQEKIIIIRSAVPTREVGFLPGTIEEKLALYELPYHDIMTELFGKKSTYQDMKDAGYIEFMSTSFIRGLTWDNAIIIVDEGENLTFHEIDSVMTRIGKNSRLIFTGDLKQTDLDGSKRLGDTGMQEAIEIFKDINSFACIPFDHHDIVRSEFVKAWIMAASNIN